MRADARSAPISAISSTHSLGGSAIWWAFGEHHNVARREITTDPGWQGPGYQTCAKAAALCRAFEISRRPEVLSFSHHAAVAALTPAEQDGLLDQAVHSTRSVIQAAVRSIEPPPGLSSTAPMTEAAVQIAVLRIRASLRPRLLSMCPRPLSPTSGRSPIPI
jgi:hypothetical protein